MTKFEQIGVNYQYEAADKASANRSFAYSCKCCCQRGMRIECDRCAIEIAHSLVIAAFDSDDLEVNIQ
jgi:hypothetical protein